MRTDRADEMLSAYENRSELAGGSQIGTRFQDAVELGAFTAVQGLRAAHDLAGVGVHMNGLCR